MRTRVSVLPSTQVEALTTLSGSRGRSSGEMAFAECFAVSDWKAWLRAEPCRKGATKSSDMPSRVSTVTTAGN